MFLDTSFITFKAGGALRICLLKELLNEIKSQNMMVLEIVLNVKTDLLNKKSSLHKKQTKLDKNLKLKKFFPQFFSRYCF